jgi:adenylosuccinate synthase
MIYAVCATRLSRLTVGSFYVQYAVMKLAVVGLQWGDEGKGKIVDYLAKDFDIDVRFQGGSNAGHTVHYKDKKVIFHQIPCGLLHKKIVGVIGAGCVFNPAVYLEELEGLKQHDAAVEERIFISKYCHLVMPYHILLDEIREKSKQGIGTTKRGIGATYEDKYGRVGLRVGDLNNPDLFLEKLRANISRNNLALMEIHHAEPLSDGAVFDAYMKYAETIIPRIADDTKILWDAISHKKNIIYEGAQGALLDIDFGTYPYVTSSHTIAGGASIGSGVGPAYVEKVLGVAKAYTTRVGLGPFPTEDKETIGKNLRDIGQEYGATTGRPRRCGAFDAAVVRYSARLSGVKEIALTKFDILAAIDPLQICIGYKNTDEFDPFIADLLVPVYKKVAGFKKDISKIRSFDDLPSQAQDYVKLVEEHTGVAVKYISVGPERDAVISR